ncbi:UdgX family uracil-DNA binding protein [Pigmentiphaga humi]|nr:UdgX family uracil-DNA binding protein [Pigmentiphaga humi]
MRILAVAGGYPGWRAQALRALAAGWPPDAVTWTESDALPASAAGQMTLDYAPAPPAQTCAVAEPAAPVPAAPVRISRDFAALLQHAALYRSTQRWALLYRALWRWQNGDRSVASAADHDGARLHAMAKAVRRARHDMIAYVRFQQRAGGGMPEYLAWYEPGHDVLASAAEHFARRMGKSSWWIGTPHGSALWDGQAMHLSGLPADPAAMPATADQVEPLWLAYYQSIFNPARLNEAALVQHMPVRFWKGLPEGPLIPAMIAQARAGARRVGQAAAVGEMPGKPVPMEAGRAQPPRALPSTLDQCRRCELWRHATQAVPGCGPQGARIMLVGEQPGDQEDLAGQPFIGPAGQVLDDALRRAELARETVYLTNAVKHFKWVARGKRRMHKTPGQREVEACAAWLEEEIARVKPRVIVALGATALRAVLRRAAALQDHLDAPVLRGDALVMATYHPSYALRVQGVRTPAQVAAHIAETLARARQLAEATLPA